MAPTRRRLASGTLFAVVILSALMPWVTVSCNGTELSVTGREMAVGRLDDNESLGIRSVPGEEADPEPFVIAALTLATVGILAALATSRSRSFAVARMGIALGGVASVIAARIDLSREIAAEFGENTGAVVQWESGWWLALIAFALAAGVQVLPDKGREEPRPGTRVGELSPTDIPGASGLSTGPARSAAVTTEPEMGGGLIMLTNDRGMLIALGGIGLVVLSMGLDWATFSPGISLDLGPLATGISVAAVAVMVILDLLRSPVPLERTNRLLGASGVLVTVIVVIEGMRLLADNRSIDWGWGVALVGALMWTTVGVAWGWPDLVASLQSAGGPLAQTTQSDTRCPQCGASTSSEARFCASCGGAMTGTPISTQAAMENERPPSPDASHGEAAPDTRCPSCGSALSAGLRYCTDCGAALRPVT